MVNVSRPKLTFNAGKRGWSRARNSSAGYPPKSACHMALWPAAHRLRRIAAKSSQPVSTAGIQSQCSRIVPAASATAGSSRSTWRAFAQNHSDE